MNAHPKFFVRAAVLAVLLLGLAGCLEKRIGWSPDGTRAFVLGDGLRLTDAAGRLTPVLAPDISVAAWLDNSRLVLVRQGEAKDWATIARLLGPERAAATEAQATDLIRQVQGGAPWSVVAVDLGGKKDVLKICLHDRHAAELQPKLTESDWKELGGKSVKFSTLLVAQVHGDTLEIKPPIYEALGGVYDLRPAPNRQLVALTIERVPEDEDLQLVVVALDGSAAPLVVAPHVSAHPDWTPDGRSIVYFSANGTDAPDSISLGVLVQREVETEAGQLKLSKDIQYLAGTIFSGWSTVRCLRDGRVIFNAAEFELPMAAADYGDKREQLFLLDPARQATLTRLIPRKSEENLPPQLAFFDVSPDEKRVVFGSTKGDVAVVTLASGEVSVVQRGVRDDLQGAPVWRSDGALTYVRESSADKAPKGHRLTEFVVRTADNKETVLSKDWPDSAVPLLDTKR